MRILLIEDSETMVAHVAGGMRRYGYDIEYALCGEGGLRSLRTAEYDLLICDIMLPDINGFDLVEELRRTNPKIPVLFLSALNTVDDRVKGLRIGGDDYLTKPFAFSELLARVQALLRRSNQSQVPEEELRVADLRLDLVRHKAYRQDREIILQPLEFKLLRFMVHSKGQVLSKALIMERMWDMHISPDSNVVEVWMHHLRNKVDKPFPNKLIHTVRGIGYMLEDRSSSKGTPNDSCVEDDAGRAAG